MKTEFIALCVMTVLFFTFVILLIVQSSRDRLYDLALGAAVFLFMKIPPRITKTYSLIIGFPGIVLILPWLAVRISKMLERTNGNKIAVLADVINWSKEESTHAAAKSLSRLFWFIVITYYIIKFTWTN